MNYEYHHSIRGTSYFTLDVPNRIPEAYQNDVVKYANKNDALKIGLSGGFCYAPSFSGNTPPLLFFSRIEPKRNLTGGDYSQCAAWLWNRDLVLNRFNDEILGMPFLRESEHDAYCQGNSGYTFGKSGWTVTDEDLEIAPEAIRAILYGVIQRWNTGAYPVRILVPRDQVRDYDKFVLRAVRTIYSYFTMGMRTRAGFASFIRPDEDMRNYPGIYLVFTTEEYADARTIRLDGSSQSAYKALCSTQGSQLNHFLDHLSGLSDPEERREFLAMVAREAEFDGDDTKITGLTAYAYQPIGQSLLLLDPRKNWEDQVAEWKKFAAAPGAIPPEIAKKVWEKVDNELDAERFARMLDADTDKCSAPGDLLIKLFDFLPLAHERRELREKIWECLARRISSIAKTSDPKTIYSELTQRRDQITNLWEGPETQEFFDTYEKAYIEQIKTDCLQRLAHRGEGPFAGIGDLRAFCSDCEQTVSSASEEFNRFGCSGPAVSEVEKTLRAESDRLLFSGIRAVFALSKEKKSDDITSAESVLSELRNLEQLIPANADDDDTRAFRVELSELEKTLESRIHVFRTGVAAQLQKMEGKDYFACLELAGEGDAELDENGRAAIRSELILRRPDTYEKYCDEFKKHYAEDLTVSAALLRSPKVREYLREDTRLLCAKSVPFELEHFLEELSERCKTLRDRSSLIGSEEPKLIISLQDDGADQNTTFDLGFVERVTGLHPTEKDISDDLFVPLMEELLARAKFSGNDLLPIHRLLRRSKKKELWGVLLELLASGEADWLDENDLRAYLAAITAEKSADRGKTLEKEVQGILESIPSKDRRLVEPFRSYLKKKLDEERGGRKTSKKKIMGLSIAAAALAVVAAVALGTTAFFASRSNKYQQALAELTEKNQEMQLMIEELTKPEELEPEEHPVINHKEPYGWSEKNSVD